MQSILMKNLILKKFSFDAAQLFLVFREKIAYSAFPIERVIFSYRQDIGGKCPFDKHDITDGIYSGLRFG